jgi:hypothetical protein
MLGYLEYKDSNATGGGLATDLACMQVLQIVLYNVTVMSH